MSQIATAYMAVVPSMRGVQQQLVSELVPQAGRAGDKAGDAAGKSMGSRISGHLKAAVGVALAAASVGAAVAQVREAVTAAGDLEQSVGAIDSVFKDSASQMHAWSRTAAKDVGLSKNSYNELATVLGSQLKNGGLALDQVGGKTNDLIGLGADLASMFGGTTKEAVEAMSSALRGETDPIERYGVSLSAARVEAEALAMGAEKVNGELPQQAKQAAILSLVYKQTADAQGNFGRESTTFAGQVQRLSASWQDLQARVGGLFLPALTQVVSFLGTAVVPALSEVAGGVQSFGFAFSNAKDGVIDITSSGFAGWMERAGNAVGTAYKVVADGLTPALSEVAGFITGTVVPAVSGLTGWLSDHKDLVTGVATVLGSMVVAYYATLAPAALYAVATGVATATTVGFRVALGSVQSAMIGAALRMMYLNAALLANPVGLVVAALVGLGVGLVALWKKSETFRSIVTGVWDGIKSAAGAVADWWTGTLMPVLSGAWSTVVDAGRGVVDWFTTAFGPALSVVGAAISTVWDGVKTGASVVVNWFVTNVSARWQATLSVVGAAFTWLNDTIIQPVWYGIRVGAAVVGAILLTIFDGIVWLVRNTLGPVFVWLYENVVQPSFEGWKIIIGGAWTWITGSFVPGIRGAMNAVGAIFSWLWTGVVTPVWNGIKAVIGLAWIGIRTYWTAIKWTIDNVLAPVFRWLWNGVVVPVWNGIKSTIANAWAGVKITWNAIKWTIDNVLAPVFRWLWNNVITPVWDGIRNTISTAWAFIRDRVFTPVVNVVRNTVGPAFRWLYDHVIRPVWDSVWSKISGVWTLVRDRAFEPMRVFVRDTLGAAFRKGVDAVKKAWDTIKGTVSGPVDFVINTVVNKGFIRNFNTLAKKFGIKELGEVSYKGLAGGGLVPGYQPRKIDDHLYPVRGGGVQPLRGGEGILVPEVVRGAGRGLVDTLNAAGNRGVGAVKRLMATGLAKGGVTSPLKRQWPLSQGYNRVHKGIDIATPVGTPIYATADGVVSHAGPGARAPGVWGGQEIHVKGGGLERWFAHLSQIMVRVGQRVKQGQLLGKTGNTGISSGPHLHFGVFRGGWPNDVNPLDYLGGAIKGDGTLGGGIVSDLLDMVGFDSLMGKIPGVGFAKDLMKGGAKMLWGGFTDFATRMLSPFDEMVSGARTGVQALLDDPVARARTVLKWTGTTKDALRRAGLPTSNSYVQAWLRQIQSESGGNPNARQGVIDVNSGGNEAAGLVQVIPSTFASFRDPSLPNNRLHPLANLVAGMRWAKHRYGVEGMLDVIGHGHGYARGGIVDPSLLRPLLYDGGGWLGETPGPQLVEHRTRKPDAVLTHEQFADFHRIARSVQDGDRGVHFHDAVYAVDPDDLWRKQKKAEKQKESLYA